MLYLVKVVQRNSVDYLKVILFDPNSLEVLENLAQ